MTRLAVLGDRSDPAWDVALAPVLLRLGLEDADEVVRFHVPAPTAAFSRRDTRQPGYAAAVEAARAAGSTPVVRPQGGRLAAYHRGSVVVDHVRREPHTLTGIEARFAEFASLQVDALATLGATVRIGAVPGEYCPGEFSLNLDGVRKVAGSAQRVTVHGWSFSTVVQVAGAAQTRAVVAAAYPHLGYDLDPATVGALDEAVPGLTPERIVEALVAAYDVDRVVDLEHLPDDLRAAVAAASGDHRA